MQNATRFLLDDSHAGVGRDDVPTVFKLRQQFSRPVEPDLGAAGDSADSRERRSRPAYRGDRLEPGDRESCVRGADLRERAARGRLVLEGTRVIVESARPRLVGAIALVENAFKETAAVRGVPVGSYDALIEAEGALLERTYAHLPLLPFDDLDGLIGDEIGENVSGSGMDTNVFNRMSDASPSSTASRLVFAPVARIAPFRSSSSMTMFVRNGGPSANLPRSLTPSSPCGRPARTTIVSASARLSAGW